MNNNDSAYFGIINRIDFAYLLSIIIALATLWMYTYQYIMDLSGENQYMSAICLSVSHYLLTLYIFMTVYICYQKGLSIINNESEKKINRFSNSMVKFFFNSWVYILLFAMVSFLPTLFVKLSDTIFIIYLLTVIFVLLSWIAYLGIKRQFKKIGLIIAAVAIYPLFLIVISTASMSFEIKTDKPLYSKNDEYIIAYAETHGYIWAPYCNVDYPHLGSSIQTWKIPAKQFIEDQGFNIYLQFHCTHPRFKTSKSKLIKIHTIPTNNNQY